MLRARNFNYFNRITRVNWLYSVTVNTITTPTYMDIFFRFSGTPEKRHRKNKEKGNEKMFNENVINT